MALALCDWERTAALSPRLRTLPRRPGPDPAFMLLGYGDDAALQRRCAENYIRRSVPAAPPLATASAIATTASAWPICRPISTGIPPPS